jgi:hypothetical protein
MVYVKGQNRSLLWLIRYQQYTTFWQARQPFSGYLREKYQKDAKGRRPLDPRQGHDAPAPRLLRPFYGRRGGIIDTLDRQKPGFVRGAAAPGCRPGFVMDASHPQQKIFGNSDPFCLTIAASFVSILSVYKVQN